MAPLSASLQQKIDRLLVPLVVMAATAAWVFTVGHWPIVGTLAGYAHIDQTTFDGLVVSGAMFVMSIVETDLGKLRAGKLQKLLSKLPVETVLDIAASLVPKTAATPTVAKTDAAPAPAPMPAPAPPQPPSP